MKQAKAAWFKLLLLLIVLGLIFWVLRSGMLTKQTAG